MSINICICVALDAETHPFNSLSFWVNLRKSAPEKLNQSGFYWSRRWWGGSDISWTICKSFAPHCRQITMLTPHHSVFLQPGCSSWCPANSVKALLRQSVLRVLHASIGDVMAYRVRPPFTQESVDGSRMDEIRGWLSLIGVMLWVLMATLRSRCRHYVFALWFLFLSSFFFSPNLSHRALDDYHTSTNGVTLVHI